MKSKRIIFPMLLLLLLLFTAGCVQFVVPEPQETADVSDLVTATAEPPDDSVIPAVTDPPNDSVVPIETNPPQTDTPVTDGADETTSPPSQTEAEETQENTPEDAGIAANVYYVSLDGDDANPGTMDEPWETFAKAVKEVKPGNTVYVMEGTYTERLIINKSGTEDAVITFMANPGDEVTIEGEGMKFESWGGLIKIDRQNYIRISGFNVINSPAMGIFACDSSYITIDNNYVYNTFAPGIHCWGDVYLTIDNNTLEWTCNEENAPLECLSLRDTFNFEICNNHVFNSGAIGIDSAESFRDGKIYNNVVHDTGLGIYLDGWDQYGSNVEVYDNVCYNNKTGFAFNSENGGTVESIKVYNNVAYGNERDGFNVGWGGVDGTDHIVKNLEITGNLSYDNGAEGFAILGVNKGYIENITMWNNIIWNNTGAGISVTGVAQDYFIRNIDVVNNTVVNNGREDIWAAGGIRISNPETTTGAMEDITIKNNIVSQNELFSISIWQYGLQPVNVVIQNNLLDGYLNDVHRYGETRGDDYIEGDPNFVDASNSDFHILEGSPAIDAASPDDAPANDFDGAARPRGEGVDIGAYEF